jgi:hypothetical protein
MLGLLGDINPCVRPLLPPYSRPLGGNHSGPSPVKSASRKLAFSGWPYSDTPVYQEEYEVTRVLLASLSVLRRERDESELEVHKRA